MMISRRRQAWLPTFVASVVFALSFSFYLSSLAVLPTLAQEAPAPTKMLQGNVTNSVPATGLSRDDLDTQRKIDTEDDQHDTNDAAIDNATRAENVAHDYHLKAIEQSQAPGEVKQEAIADENERHQDALEHFQRQQAEEDERHAERLAAIKAAAGKLLSGAASAVGNSLNTNNGGAVRRRIVVAAARVESIEQQSRESCGWQFQSAGTKLRTARGCATALEAAGFHSRRGQQSRPQRPQWRANPAGGGGSITRCGSGRGRFNHEGSAEY